MRPLSMRQQALTIQVLDPTPSLLLSSRRTAGVYSVTAQLSHTKVNMKPAALFDICFG